MAISPLDGLVYHSVQIGGINAQRFDEFVVQTRQLLDPDELVFFIYDGAPAHRNAANPGANTKLKMLPPKKALSSTLLNKPSVLWKQRWRLIFRNQQFIYNWTIEMMQDDKELRLVLCAKESCWKQEKETWTLLPRIGISLLSGIGLCKLTCPAV